MGSTRLIGRSSELMRLESALSRSAGGDPVAVVIGGEAGVGKTRLIEEFAAWIGDGGARGDTGIPRGTAGPGNTAGRGNGNTAGRGNGNTAGRAGREAASVLTVHCLDLGEQGLPFAPFAEALRTIMKRDGAAVFAGQEWALTRLLPELGEPGLAPGPGAAAVMGSDAPRGYLFELVAELLERLAERRRLVLVVEDVHWADRSTRDLVDFLIRVARPAGVLLLITYRSDELHRGHPLRSFLGELDRLGGVERFELGRLDRQDTADLLVDLLGWEPTPAAVDDIYARAQGNPFFTQELAAVADPSVCCRDMPETLRDLLLSRIDRLPEPVRRVLRIAAAGGVRTSHALLTEVTGRGEPGLGDEAELEAALRAAVAAQLLVTDPDDGDYEFRHALVQEAVHDDLLPGERVRLHARYAEAIEAHPGLVSAGRAPADIARHWYVARNPRRALVAAYAAATDAGSRYAHAEQSQLLDRVLDLWEQVPDAPDLLGMDHLRVLEEGVEAAWAAGANALAFRLSRAAIAEIDDAAEPLRAASMLMRQGNLRRVLGKGDGVADVHRAYALAAPLTDPRRVSMLVEMAMHLRKVGEPGWEPFLAEAAAAAEQRGDAALDNVVRLGHLRARRMDRTVDGAIEGLRAAADTARAVGDRRSLVLAMVCLSDIEFEVGDYRQSRRTAEQGRRDATRFGIGRSTGVYLISNEAEALIALGRWDEADALCTETERLSPPGSHAIHWLTLRSRLWQARGQAGAPAVVSRALGYLSRPSLDLQQKLPLHELRISGALAGGDREEILATIRDGLGVRGWQRYPRYAWPMLVLAAQGLLAHGGREQVAELAEAAGRLVARYPAERACAAQTAAILAPREHALDAWRAAVAAWRADGQPYQLALALLRLAEDAAAAGDRAGTREALAEAHEIALSLAAVPLASQVVALAGRIGAVVGEPAPWPGGIRPLGDAGIGGGEPSTAQQRPAAHAGLTARERQVLRLIAEGRSNRLIAEQLFITPKTASVHVSRIIAKLAVASRGEAAAVARRLGLLD